jgi:RsmE family RNA methyltransferase
VNLLLVEASEVEPNRAVRVADRRARHLLRVLRVTPGQYVRVGIVDGPLGQGIVERTSDDAVELRCTFDEAMPSRPPVDLLLALPRPKVLQRLWAQLAALGVGHIALTNAEKVERDYFDTHVVTPETYRPLLIEGLQQARDTRVPTVSLHKRFRVVVEDELDAQFGRGIRLVAHPNAPHGVAHQVSATHATRALLAVGPEGGWNAFERELLRSRGFLEAGMGPRTLRSDTAAVALLALVHDALRFP